MASHDFIMRQVEGITDLLSVFLFDRTASDIVETVYETGTTSSDHNLLIDLRFFVGQGWINEAENLLFAAMEDNPQSDYRRIACQFYAWLDALDDHQLAAARFSRSEIAEGRGAVEAFYAKSS